MVSKEEIDEAVAEARQLVHLADENDRLREERDVFMKDAGEFMEERNQLRAQLAEAVAGLEGMSRMVWLDEIAESATALLAKLKGTP